MPEWDEILATPRSITVTDQDGQPANITLAPRIKDRERHGERRVTITVAALLADRLAEIDPQYRAFAGDMLRGAKVELREHPDPRYTDGSMRHVAAHRRDGMVRTTYVGDGIVPVAQVLDLGEQLWDHFFAAEETA